MFTNPTLPYHPLPPFLHMSGTKPKAAKYAMAANPKFAKKVAMAANPKFAKKGCQKGCHGS